MTINFHISLRLEITDTVQWHIKCFLSTFQTIVTPNILRQQYLILRLFDNNISIVVKKIPKVASSVRTKNQVSFLNSINK